MVLAVQDQGRLNGQNSVMVLCPIKKVPVNTVFPDMLNEANFTFVQLP